MDKKERILDNKINLASEAALKLKSYQKRSDEVKKEEQIEREKSNLIRESKRTEIDKIVSATERIVRVKDDSKVKPPLQKIEIIRSPVARLHAVFDFQ